MDYRNPRVLRIYITNYIIIYQERPLASDFQQQLILSFNRNLTQYLKFSDPLQSPALLFYCSYSFAKSVQHLKSLYNLLFLAPASSFHANLSHAVKISNSAIHFSNSGANYPNEHKNMENDKSKTKLTKNEVPVPNINLLDQAESVLWERELI